VRRGSPGALEKLYREKKPTDVGRFQIEPARSLEWIRNVAPSKEAAIVDVGGGASVLVEWLLDLDHGGITALDLSGAAHGVSRSRLGGRGDRVPWVEADVNRCDADLASEVRHDRAVFHSLTETQDRQDYGDLVRRPVRPRDHVILAAFDTDGREKCSGLPMRLYDALLLQAEFGSDFERLRSGGLSYHGR